MSKSVAKDLRILSFNHHESFLSAMAPLGYHFDIVVRYGDLDLSWNKAARQPPENFRLLDYEEVKADLRQGLYDAVICHTIKNLIWLFWINRCPTIFVAHIPLYWDRPSRSLKSLGKLLVLWIYGLRHRLRSVAVSEWKQSTWGLRGSIVRFFPIAFPSHLLAAQKARTIIPVIVGNGIRSRGLELGWDLLQTLVKEFPLRILGRNPDIPEATQPRDYAEFVQLFSESHFYVFTIRQPEGDGYNTAMLEAMRLGLPVVTIANPSSPIIHGFNGLVAQSLPELRQHIKTLMLSPSLIEKLGAAAQETVTSQFSEQSFLAAWREALHDS